MREADVQAVLLVQAFEEADLDGRLIGTHERVRATEEARAEAGDDPERFLAARAEALVAVLEARVPLLRGVVDAGRWGVGLARLAVVMALIAGLTTNALGPSQRVNILSAPLLGLLAWNLFVYLLIVIWVVRVLAGRKPKAPPAEEGSRAARRRAMELAKAGVTRVGGLAGRLAEWAIGRALRRTHARRAADQAVVGAALARFAESWRAASVALMAARLRRLLHLGALVLVTGSVAGMYVRGLGLAYHATWESTFLDAGAVKALLGTVLWPAAALLGWHLPDVAPLEAPGTGPAATWIHLYAVTCVLIVLIPRGLLALWETARVRKLSASLPLDRTAAYFRRLVAPTKARAATVDVCPYSFRMVPRQTDTLAVLLHDLFGPRADVRVGAGAGYGAEAEAVLPRDHPGADGELPWCGVLLFTLSQSPESEVHGRLVEELRGTLGEDQHLLVLVDGSSYREQVGGATHRLDERRRAWDRVLREAGQEAVHVDLDRPPPAELTAMMGGALWPPEPA